MKNYLQPLSCPPYDNASIRTREGDLLCRSSVERAQWYLDRGLAEKVSETPFEIKLLFEPKGLGNKGDEYMLAERANACVVCGGTDSLTLHHIVPLCFRVHFPGNASHNAYDVMPLCVDCHVKYEIFATEFKKKLFAKNAIGDQVTVIDKVAMVAAKSAHALLVHGAKIPVEKKQVLEGRVKKFLGLQSLSEDDLRVAEAAKWHETPCGTQSERLVQGLKDIDEFAILWRKHFLDTMCPKHVSPLWDPNKRAYGSYN
jgi:5-methylcytosine-specific restriction endonuclease McrA